MMGYDPAIHERTPSPVARRYVDDYLPPKKAVRVELGIRQRRAERARAKRHREHARREAIAQVARDVGIPPDKLLPMLVATPAGRQLLELCVDQQLVIWRFQYPRRGVPAEGDLAACPRRAVLGRGAL